MPAFAWVVDDIMNLKVTYAYVTLSTLVVLAVLGCVLGRWFDRVRLLSITDPLTGLFNRRYFRHRLVEEIRRGDRYGRTTCVLCADIDRFKVLNDRLGHKAGDHLLVAVSQILLRSVRSVDAVARVGGDEFAVLLPETSAIQASALSQRILTEVARHNDAAAGRLAVSIGIAELNSMTNLRPDELLAAADAALYRAKAAGGGRAALARPESVAPHSRHMTMMQAALLLEEPNYFGAHADHLLDGDRLAGAVAERQRSAGEG